MADMLKGKVALGVLCTILGLTISMQFKAVKGNTGGILSTQKAQQLALELKNLRTERTSLMEELTLLEKRLKEYQNKRLRETIKFAYKHIPYYKEVFATRGLTPEDIRTTDDLIKLPILNKKIIREEGIDNFIYGNIFTINLLLFVKRIRICFY